MFAYLARRVGMGIVVFVCVTGITFLLFFIRGGENLAAHFVSQDNASREVIHQKAEALGLLRPLWVQYSEWFGGLLHGDLGQSYQTGESVVQVLTSRAGVTFSLMVVSLVLTIVLGVALGVAAATRGGVIDRGLQIFTVVVQAIPGFWLALVLAIVFGLILRLVPATGYIPITESVGGWFSSIILPATSIALGSMAFVAAQVRGSMLGVLRQDYVRTLRSRGISARSIVWRHAMRNIAAPTLAILSTQTISLLGGAVFVERIFALPGLGTITVSSGQSGDVPIVLGAVVYVIIVIVVVNLITDIASGLVNPKVRIA